MKVTCVIPAWNEVKLREHCKLPEVVDALKGKVDSIVIVEDGSDDETYAIASSLPAAVLRHAVNRGQGAALKTGTIYALQNGADIIVHFDADGQFRVQDIETVIEPIRDGKADIVFGSRFLDASTKMPLLKKHFIMPLAQFVNRFFFKIKMSDPQSGFRALSRRAAEAITWEQDRMAHCSEILSEAHASGLRISEVPITVLYSEHGRGLGNGFKILYEMLLAKLNHH